MRAQAPAIQVFPSVARELVLICTISLASMRPVMRLAMAARAMYVCISYAEKQMLVGLPVVPVVVVRKQGVAVLHTKASGFSRSASLEVRGMRAISSKLS